MSPILAILVVLTYFTPVETGPNGGMFVHT